MMNSVAIIGAGQLGSRHLQAMALHRDPLIIFLVDPSSSALESAKKRYEEVDVYKNKEIKSITNIFELPPKLQLAIIATNSIPRFMLMEQLLQRCTVKYLLLEKFLFPLKDQYSKAEELLDKSGTVSYVNCARRIWPNYKEIKEQIQKDEKISLTVIGKNWGLGSNAIHFLDLFSYLTDDLPLTLNNIESASILKSKRDGYNEIAGILKGKYHDEERFLLKCTTSNEAPFLKIIIESENQKYVINEADQECIFNESDYQIKRHFKLYYQSELTYRVYEQLMNEGKCDLPTFQESASLHLKILTAFEDVLNEKGGVIT